MTKKQEETVALVKRFWSHDNFTAEERDGDVVLEATDRRVVVYMDGTWELDNLAVEK